MQQRWSDLVTITRTSYLYPTGRCNTMETRFYQTQEINISLIAQALVFEYQAQEYEAQQFGDFNQITVQLKKE